MQSKQRALVLDTFYLGLSQKRLETFIATQSTNFAKVLKLSLCKIFGMITNISIEVRDVCLFSSRSAKNRLPIRIYHTNVFYANVFTEICYAIERSVDISVDDSTLGFWWQAFLFWLLCCNLDWLIINVISSADVGVRKIAVKWSLPWEDADNPPIHHQATLKKR